MLYTTVKFQEKTTFISCARSSTEIPPQKPYWTVRRYPSFAVILHVQCTLCRMLLKINIFTEDYFCSSIIIFIFFFA
jgi:hypothetical protein